ncbi:hypothetical protein ABKN59_005610 [Abortiporus biennis]
MSEPTAQGGDVLSTPMLIFPPFPTPPPNTTITPFSAFKPSGYPIRFEELDQNYEHTEREVDSLGIPTVQLKSKHSLTEQEQKRRKMFHGSRRTAGGVVRENGVVKKVMWYEEWAEGEIFRKTSTPINSDASRVDRLHQACQDFRTSRSWPNVTVGLQQLWDTFRFYIGIINYAQNPGRKNHMQRPDPNDDDEDDDEEPGEDDNMRGREVELVDDEEARARREKQLQEEIEAKRKKAAEDQAASQARFERRLDMKDARMNFFFDDPAMALKIYFSAHFRDKGLIWDKRHCRDGPILIEFFINFILRNRVLPEYEVDLRKALLVLKQARNDLPMTFEVGEALPDKFSGGCESLFGSMTQALFTQSFNDNDTENETEEAKADDTHHAGVDSFKEFIASTVDSDTNVVGGSSSWGTGSGWGNLGSGEGWGDPEPEEDPSDINWLPPPENPLFALIGPTVFPLTHTTGIVERSTRKIIKVIPPPQNVQKKKVSKLKNDPASAVEDELANRFAQMVLAPWKKVGNHDKSDIQAPEILPDSRGKVFVASPPADTDEAESTTSDPLPSEEGHNMRKDEITVLVEPELVDVLTRGTGLGLTATWVQIVRSAGEDESEAIKDESNKRRRKAKKLGGPGQNGTPTKFWYMEQLMSTLPSFHSDRYYPNQPMP